MHLFKLIINKRRQNFFLFLQLFISFLALFLFFGLNIKKFTNYFKPLGYEFENAWLVEIDLKDVPAAERPGYTALIKDKLSSLKEVSSVSQPDLVPFHSWGRSGQKIKYKKQVFKVTEFEADEAFRNVLNIKLLSGKWLSKEKISSIHPIVVTRSFASELFDGKSPLGKTIDILDDSDVGNNKKALVKALIIGLVEDFRENASSNSGPAYFINSNIISQPYARFLLKSPIAGQFQLLEDKIRRNLSAIDSQDIEIKQNAPLSLLKKYAHKTDYIQLTLAFIVFVFLIINVFVGVTGVFTYNLSKRGSEIGLRIAMGATSTAIWRQLLGETLTLTSIGIFPGVLIAIQLLIMRYFEPYMTTSFGVLSLVMSALFLYLLMLSCAVYPSLKASRIQPAEALHED